MYSAASRAIYTGFMGFNWALDINSRHNDYQLQNNYPPVRARNKGRTGENLLKSQT